MNIKHSINHILKQEIKYIREEYSALIYCIVRLFNKKKAIQMMNRDIERKNEEMRKYLSDRRLQYEKRLKQIDEEYEQRARIRRKKHYHLK